MPDSSLSALHSPSKGGRTHPSIRKLGGLVDSVSSLVDSVSEGQLNSERLSGQRGLIQAWRGRRYLRPR